MAGIYIHIPFCKQKCHYCDFHFSTSLRTKEDLLKALVKEIQLQQNFLEGETINTVYLGGGTPSILKQEELMQLFDVIYQTFPIAPDAEITIEANPDDLQAQKVKELKQTPVNRFSIGVQSFQNADLQFMNRAHSAEEALDSIKCVQDVGWENITIDLIYGTPTLSDKDWQKNMQTAINLAVLHISAYALMVEENTALQQFIEHKICAPVEEEKSARQFLQLMETLHKADFIQYEISNFGKEGFFSKHNSNYWKGEKYLGIGPSAHSFNGTDRQWNISNNVRYIQQIAQGTIPAEKEQLNEKQRYNDYIFTTLRTIWGINMGFVKSRFSNDFETFLLYSSKKWIDSEHILKNQGVLILSEKGKLIADHIAADLFWVD
tara:strand:- start:1238 stop:2368 length:1131 start_codon:yes stop_codon:yes gene_type:complete